MGWWGSTFSRLQSHYKETVYFLPLSPQEVLILIWSTLEPPIGFEPGTTGLGIQRPNHLAIAHVVQVHKWEDKNLLKNYRPISLLPIFHKIFKRVDYNSLFNHFQSNKLFTSSQSGFLLPGDSCIAQLLSIIHEIQTTFDNNPTADVRCISFHFKSLAWRSFNREQRVVLNGQTSGEK